MQHIQIFYDFYVIAGNRSKNRAGARAIFLFFISPFSRACAKNRGKYKKQKTDL